MKRILGVHPDGGAPQFADGLGGVAAFFAKVALASSSSSLAPGLPRSTASGGNVTKRATDEVRRRDAGVAPG